MSDDVGKSVRDRLLSTKPVTDYCGARIYPDVLEQGAIDKGPCVAVFVSATLAHEDIDNDNRCFQSTVDVIAWGRNRDEVNALAKAIRDSALPADLRGSVEGMDWMECSLIAGPIELVDPPTDGSDRWRKITKQTFSIWAHAV